MIITCEACNTSFNLDDKMLKSTGSKVRCSVCATVFTAFPSQAPSPGPVGDAVEPETAPPSEAIDDTDLAAPAAAASAEADKSGDGGSADAPAEDAETLFGDGSDLDFVLDEAPQADSGSGSGTVEDDDQTIIASLDDDDFDLDFSLDPAADDGAATIIADLDDDQNENQIPDMGETVLVDLDQEDFQLDVPLETDDEQDGATVVIADLDGEELSVDEDFSLEFEQETETADAGDDLDFSLDLDDGAPVAEAVESDATDAVLDDLNLDFDLEADTDTASVDSAGGVGPEAGSTVLEDDLDLSGLAGLLDEDEPPEDDDVTMVIDEGKEPELTLEVDGGTPDSGAGDAGNADEILADLDLDLDEEDKTDVLHAEDTDSTDQEIDLSEIEKMLEEPKADDAKFSVPEQDLDLDIEASLETEKWMSESGGDGPLVKDEELDLSELEQVLEDVDTDVADDTPEDQELELDLSDEKPLGDPTETVAIDTELDFDLSDFEDDIPVASDAGEAPREPADMELEFEVEEESQKAQSLADEGLEETVAIPESGKKEPTEEKPAEPAVAATRVPKPVKKGMSKSLVFLLIIAILGGAGYGTYYLLNQSGIEIPFLSNYFKPKVQDPGNLQLTTYDINSKFIDNANVGKLFVISGKVKNGYPDNRGMISLVGKIFSSGKVPVHEEKVYCGNVMSDLELANLEWDKINARLANRLGDNRSNVKIEPGKSVSFMVVFSGLPDDLEEFTIEVLGSTSLK